MPTLLYIQASPREEQSFSLRLAGAFVGAYVEAHPDARIETLNLFDDPLPPFDALAAKGKYALMRGEKPPAEAKEAWERVLQVIGFFKTADVYAVAAPMWNFGVPYVLKHYIDLVTQPDLTFQVGENGYEGLLKGRSAFLACARGGDLTEHPETDFQAKYLEHVFQFMGIGPIRSVVVQPTMAKGKDAAEEALDKAIREAREIAPTL